MIHHAGTTQAQHHGGGRGRAAATGAERLRPPPHGALAALYHPWPGAGAVQRRARAWPLHRAAVRVLDRNLVAAAGLPEPVDEPVGHWSPGVRTRISALRPVGAPDRRTLPAAVTQPARRQMALATGYPADGRSPQLPRSHGRWVLRKVQLVRLAVLPRPAGTTAAAAGSRSPRPVVGLAAPAARRRDPPDRPPGHAHPSAARGLVGPVAAMLGLL